MLWDHGFPQNFLINSTQVPQNFHSINHHKIIYKPVNSTVFPQLRELSLIMTGRGGGGSISENSQKNFKPPPIQEIKIQTPSRFQRIISDPNTSLQRENIHILISNACPSICPSVIGQDLSQYQWLMQVPKNSVSSKDN